MTTATRLAAVAVISIAAIVSVSAQPRPDFSGKWISIADSPAPPPSVPSPNTYQMSRPWANEVTITQDSKTVTIDYVSFSRAHAPVKLVYNLDGSETHNIDRNSVDPQDRLCRAAWRGSRLVLTTVMPRVGRATGAPDPQETIQELALESSGVLTVNGTQHFQGRTGAVTARFRKQ